ncbi:hypothetical protein LSM04_006806 [Trypanosoma melophagium]|uniref:uncharacterized protein n=1 Tax=Trypanosoma melophagium TaxID=715481 RepID=UPI00351A1D6F|nr:hypothetical protein LSM04_006806 [Trypanosoma melophagium]
MQRFSSVSPLVRRLRRHSTCTNEVISLVFPVPQRCECSHASGISTSCNNSNNNNTMETQRPLQNGRDPMLTLTTVFRNKPSALRLHRELTLCLANGEAEKAADLASVLAETVRRVILQETDKEQKETSKQVVSTTSSDNSVDSNTEGVKDQDMPRVVLDDIEYSVEKMRHSLISNNANNTVNAFIEGDAKNISETESSEPSESLNLPFWKQTSALRVTLLETSFEMTLPEGDDVENPLSLKGAEVEQHEKECLSLLDEYLAREQKRWEAQKKAIGRVILLTAQRLGIIPEDLFSSRNANSNTDTPSSHDGRFRVFKHCNLIVRGEVPETAELLQLKSPADNDIHATVAEELRILVQRMEERGCPLSPREKEMALFELIMTKSKMRYIVGLHRELQVALDESNKLRELCSQKKLSIASEAFSHEVIEKLNKLEPDGTEKSAEEVELIELLSTPVIPFTFMMKMCLWFDIPKGEQETL